MKFILPVFSLSMKHFYLMFALLWVAVTVIGTWGLISEAMCISKANAREEVPAEAEKIKAKLTVGGREFKILLNDNMTTRALTEKFPMTVTMEDLYSRELSFRMGAGALPFENTCSEPYEVGEIVYWPPRGSLVILYEQNGEKFSRVHVGKVEGPMDFFKTTGSTEVTWELVTN